MKLFRLRTLTTLAGISAVGGVLYFKDPRASAYQYVVMPLGRTLVPDGELSHNLTIKYMEYPFLVPRLPKRWIELVDPEHVLRTNVFGTNPRVRKLTLATPIGIAAGFDKDAKAIDSLFQLGFSWVEVGSVTPLPQPGNPKPRVFRLPEDRAFINRYGFNSEGHAAVAARLELREQLLRNKPKREGQYLAVNLGKNKTGDEIEDYVKGVRLFGPLADALVVNVSSPNTPGLRNLQAGDKLTTLLKRLVSERNALDLPELPPLVVKIAPDIDLDQINAIAKAVTDSGIDGVIVSNTTVGRPGLKSPRELQNQNGGLSGKPLKPLALQALRQLRARLSPDVTVIGCGGISTAKDALEFAEAGADFVELYSSFAYDGFGKAANISQDLVAELTKNKMVWNDRK